MLRKEIRFAVGEAGNQLSPVLKVWNIKNDVYLTGRFTGGMFKVSLHASGVWTVTATTESGATPWKGNRRMKAWQRPKEFQVGWTWGPHIAVPRVEHVDHIVFDEQQKKLIEWIPIPEKGMKATIAIVFAASTLNSKDLSQIYEKGSAYLEEYLELENGQKVFIGVQYENLSKSDHTIMHQLTTETDEVIRLNPEGIKGLIAIFMQSAEVPYIYTMKFGLES